MKQAYKHVLLICILVIVICFAMRLFGYSGFYIPVIESSLNNNIVLITICYGMLYTINAILIIILIVKRKLKPKELIMSAIVFTILYIIGLLFNIGYIKFIIELVLFIVLPILYSKNKFIIIESIIMYCLVLTYQAISMSTKGIVIELTKETFTTNLILNLDYYMLLATALLYLCMKGEHVYELVYKLIGSFRRRSLAINRILPKRNSEEKCLQQNEENVFEIGYFIFNIGLFILQMLLVLSICYFIKNTLINVVLIYISFVILRKVFGESYHADSILKCTVISVTSFITATSLSLDINISLLSSVFIGLVLAYAMKVYYYYDQYVKCNSDLTKLPLDELRTILHYLSDIEVNMVYDYWHKESNITVDDIADKYGYNKMKVYRTLKKIKGDNL